MLKLLSPNLSYTYYVLEKQFALKKCHMYYSSYGYKIWEKIKQNMSMLEVLKTVGKLRRKQRRNNIGRNKIQYA